MKDTKAGYSEESLSGKIIFWHLVFFTCTLSLDRLYSQLAFYSLIAHVLLTIKRHNLRKIFTTDFFILSIPFLYSLITVTYSTDKGEGFKIVERQSIFLLLPVVLIATQAKWIHYRERLLSIFSWSMVVILLFLFWSILKPIVSNRISLSYLWHENFTNHNFSQPVDMHATYFAMYLFLAMAVFFTKFTSAGTLLSKCLYIGVLLFCAVGELQLLSRSVSLAMLIAATIVVPLYFAPHKRKLWYILTAILITAIPLSIILKQSNLRQRYISEVREDLSAHQQSAMVVEPRMARWNVGLEVVKQRPLFGYGGGAEKQLLMSKYLEKGFLVSYVNKLNTHNQYLNYLITGGIVGLVVFIAYLALGAIHSIKNRDFVFSCFLLLLIIVSFSENVFATNKGIFFIAFFFPFLWLSRKQKPLPAP